jgi:hypothetical protein
MLSKEQFLKEQSELFDRRYGSGKSKEISIDLENFSRSPYSQDSPIFMERLLQQQQSFFADLTAQLASQLNNNSSSSGTKDPALNAILSSKLVDYGIFRKAYRQHARLYGE